MKPYSEMTQEERINAFLASQQMMDQEDVIYKQQALPPEARFGGEFGLPSFLGFIGGKDRGRVRSKTVGINEPYTFEAIGKYYREDPQKTSSAKREEIILSRIDPRDRGAFRRYYQGIPEPDMVYVDYPADSPEYAEPERSKETMQTMRDLAGVRQRVRDPRLTEVAGVTAHELDHRFYDLPVYKDMVDFYSDPENIPIDEMDKAGLFSFEGKKAGVSSSNVAKRAKTSPVMADDTHPEVKKFFLASFFGLPTRSGYDSQHEMAINPVDRRFRPSLRAYNIKDYLEAAEKLNVNKRALRYNEQYGDGDKGEELRKQIKKQQESFQGTFADDDENIELARRRDFLIRHYLTPERQEQYGLRLPAKETRAKTYEQLIEEQEESGVMDKIFALIGKLSN